MYYIYIVRCNDDSLYTGITTDVCKRMKEHYYKTKHCAKYTRVKGIKHLEMLWISENRSMASRLEYQIKKLRRSQKEQLIANPESVDPQLYTSRSAVTLQQCLENTTIE